MHSLKIEKEELRQYINVDFEVELLDGACEFTEGPVWKDDGFYLFSDIPKNVIYQLTPGQEKEVYLPYSGCTKPEEAELPKMMGSNGLAYHTNGNLLICQHGNHCIAQYDEVQLKPLIGFYEHAPLNSPNDIMVSSDGRVFFSDPPYGLKDQKINSDTYQPIAGFYWWKDDELHLFCDQYQYPNGLCISADQRFLYTCSNKPFEAFVLEFDLKDMSLVRTVCKEASDGIKCDKSGNLYLCNKDGILMINNKGERLGLIQLPTVPANCCWGGAEMKDLFICARENVFLIRNLLK